MPLCLPLSRKQNSSPYSHAAVTISRRVYRPSNKNAADKQEEKKKKPNQRRDNIQTSLQPRKNESEAERARLARTPAITVCYWENRKLRQSIKVGIFWCNFNINLIIAEYINMSNYKSEKLLPHNG